MANSSNYDVIVYALVGAYHVEVTGAKDTDRPQPRQQDGDIFPGVTFGGKYIDTFACAIQPGGAGGWAYELIDYRLNISNAGNIAGSGQPKIWTEYASKYIKVGNPLDTSSLTPCTPRYCTENDQSACGDAWYKNPVQADWLVLSCQSSSAPSGTKYSCTNGVCEKDSNGQYTSLSSCQANCQAPSGTKYSCTNGVCGIDPNGQYTSLSSCQANCQAPDVPKCKNIVDGAAHNYCSGWCGSSSVWPNCGVNTMNNGQQCDCTGCPHCQ